MKLPRPYIPLHVRVQVAERQFAERYGDDCYARQQAADYYAKSARDFLAWLLGYMFGLQPVELHHRPALCNRVYVRHWAKGRGETVTYDPPANDPNYLIYLPADEHDIETRVRGEHGDYSDLAKARKRKRKERKAKRRKTRWPSRPMRSANRWPK